MNFCDLIIKLISICMAIRGYAKDIHYSAQGNNMYGEHIFADVVESPDNDILDELKEVCFLGRNYRVPESSFLMQESIKYYPAKTNDDSQNWSFLRSLIAQAMFIIEQISQQATAGEANIIGAIAQELQKNIGLINLRLGFPLLEEEDLGDIANNERWITVKPHGDEEKDKPSDGADKKQEKSSDTVKKSQDIKKEIDSLEKELDSLINEKREKIYKELKEKYKDEPYSYDKEFRIFEETKEKSGANDLMKQKNEIKEKIVEKKKEYRKTIASEYFYPEKIANVARGPEMSREKANGGSVNPKYMERGGYSINCQSCVVCYEARLRGYDVSTKPNTKGSKLNELSREAHAAWIDPETGNYPKILSPETEIKNYKKYYDFLKNSVEEGKRYNFSYLWKGKTRSGHIVSMYKENGDLILYDPQTGGKYKNDEMINHYLKGIKFSVRSGGFTFNVLPKLYRVDNMAFNPDYVNDIMEAANGR